MAGNVYSDPIEQGYGATSNSAEPAYGGYAHFHQGIDYGAPYGTPVPAVAGGVVLPQSSFGESGYGPNIVMVQQPNGKVYLYGHMESSNVVPGQVIQPGQIIGAVGSAGNSYGPHLHLGLLSSTGQPLDPNGGLPLQGVPVLGGIAGAIGGLASGLGGAASNAPVIGGIPGTGVGQAVGGALGGIGGTIGGAASGVGGTVSGALGGIGGFVGLIFGGVVRFVFTLVGLGVIILGFYILFGHPKQDIEMVGKVAAAAA